MSPTPPRLEVNVVSCHMYDLGALELQIEDKSIDLDIVLRFPSERALGQFLDDAKEIHR